VAGAVPIVPRHIWSEVPDAAPAQDLELLVGSGPYRLESYSQAESSYLYVANDDFFLGEPFVQRLELVPLPNELDALLAGEIEAAQPDVEGAGAGALAPFRQDEAFEVIEGPAGTGFFTGLSWSVAREGPVSDRRFRHACALAIDRQELVDRLLDGQGAPGNPGFFPPDHPFRVDVEQYAFDPQAANRLLDEAGYRRMGLGPRRGPDGQALRLSLLSAGAPPATELVVRSLEAVGVGVEVESVELFQAFSRLNSGDYEMAVHPGGGVAGAPDFMRQIYSSDPDTELFFAAHGYRNEEFDELAESQRVTVEEDQRRQMFARMQEIVAEDLPLLVLYYPAPFLIQRKGGFDAWTFPDPATLYNPETATSGKQSFVNGRTSGLEIRPTQ
jgi:peptide/nickel transport system substrate-binding protein